MIDGLRRRAAICAAATLLASCSAQPPPPSSEIDEAGFRNVVRVLASDDFEGRKPGTAGEEKTVGFLIDQFRKLGLKPGNGESYLQAVPMVEMLPAGDPSLSVAGHGAPHALAYAKDMVIWSERAMPEAALERSELVFAGYGIVAQDYAWDDYAGLDVHGKTVVVLVNDPGHDAKDPRVFRGDAETRYGRWDYKVDEAARHGAAGVLLIHDAGAAGYGWNVVLNERTGALLAAPTPDDAARPAVAGWLSAASTIDLFKRAGLDFAALRAAAARPGFKGVDLGLTVDARVHNTIRHFTSSNVVAVLPGARHKPEYVVYTAHWDALGRQSAAAGGALLNGAVDDASGVAGLLMLAQSLSRTRPQAERSAVFIAFTGEASGLIGSRYYVDNPVFPLRRTAGVLSLDALRIGGPTRDVMVFGFGNSEMEDYLREVAQQEGKELHPDLEPGLGSYYGSDQFSFAKAGVPALYAQGGFDDSARGPAWGKAQFDDFVTHRSHQASDKYSPDWDVRGTLDDLRLYYLVGDRLARGRRFPRWYPNSEFRGSHHRAPDPGE